MTPYVIYSGPKSKACSIAFSRSQSNRIPSNLSKMIAYQMKSPNMSLKLKLMMMIVKKIIQIELKIMFDLFHV